ncbi:BAR adaptor protein Hob3 [Microbotryomycetes sp. JL201]|nr:BAR adaptor protein Hob3 [Microbotryomycetes sp. JL201]
MAWTRILTLWYDTGWAGLKKAVNRAGTNVMMKTGQVERTDDSEFKREEAMYRTLEKNSSALQKEAKAYLDAVRNFSGASSRIGNTIDMFFGTDAGEQAMSANAYKRATDELESSVSTKIDGPYRATVLDPISKLVAYWPEVNNAITKRNHKLTDYDAARSRARKLANSDDTVKARAAEAESDKAEEIYQLIDAQVRNDIPVLLDLRVPYLDPSFECFIRMQSHFATDGYEKLGGVQRYFADGVREDYAAGQLDAQVEGCLAEMRELSICGER